MAEAAPALGAVWAYCDRSGQVVVHRYLGRRRSGLVFKGDGSPRPDPLVDPSLLVGRVAEVRTPSGAQHGLGWADRARRGIPAVAAAWGRGLLRRARRPHPDKGC